MPDWPDYELLDFGAGRKWERFGDLVVDRPCPAAGECAPTAKTPANAKYTGAKVGDGKWKSRQPGTYVSPDGATIDIPLAEKLSFRMQLELSPAGQVGLFPEQFANWRWIAKQIRRRSPASVAPSPRFSGNAASPASGGGGSPLRVLNLFAYTGGSTMAAAVAGPPKSIEVTHVDASKPSVALARQNAEHSGLGEAPIRWIVEDVLKYCRREVKRGNQYDAVILDPPSYGHGPKGEEWKLTRDLPELLQLCGELTADSRVFLLATCHTPGVGPAELSAYLSDGIVGHCGQPPASGRLWLKTASGRRLESGVYARWPR